MLYSLYSIHNFFILFVLPLASIPKYFRANFASNYFLLLLFFSSQDNKWGWQHNYPKKRVIVLPFHWLLIWFRVVKMYPDFTRGDNFIQIFFEILRLQIEQNENKVKGKKEQSMERHTCWRLNTHTGGEKAWKAGGLAEDGWRAGEEWRLGIGRRRTI